MESVAPILDAIAKGGPAAIALIFALLWWMERGERIKAQKALNDLAIRTLASVNRLSNAIRDLRFVWTQGKLPDPAGYQLEDPSEILGDG